MLLPGKTSPRTWLFVTILVSTIIAFSESSSGKTLNIKIGFDLTQGSNGAPSLRIRDFEDSAEYNPRAVDDDSSSDSSSGSSKKKTSPRAESSGSDEKLRSKKEEGKEAAKAPKSSNDSDDDDDDEKNSSREDKPRSTRGLKAGDFEPEEENPKIHARYKKDSDSENSDDDRRRFRRSINIFDK